MDKLKLYFGLILLTILGIFIKVGILILLIIFSPVILFTNNKTFYYIIDELYKTIKL